MASKNFPISIKTLSILGTVVAAFCFAGCGSVDGSSGDEAFDDEALESESIGALHQGLVLDAADTAFASTLLALESPLSAADVQRPIKRVRVTNQALAGRPADEALVLDLTQDGTVYAIAAEVDQSRVQLLTSGSELTMSDMTTSVGMAFGEILVGTFQDMSNEAFVAADDGTFQRPEAVAEPAKCIKVTPSVTWCSCVGGKDCKDLDKARICNSKTKICTKGADGKWGCNCLKKA